MKALHSLATLFSLFVISASAWGCDVTLSSGTGVISAAVSGAATGDEICLNPGSYSESSTIALKAGQTLRGLGTDIEDTAVYSNAFYIITFSPGSSVQHFLVQGTSSAGYGLVLNSDDDSLIWDMTINYVQNPIHLTYSNDVGIWNVFVNSPGIDNSAPDPSVWIDESDNVEILYGSYVGRSNGVGGDGEIACRNSDYLSIYGTHVGQSGAAGMYFVNCDSATVEEAIINSGDEWGLDVVDGSNNFTAIGNTISGQFWGAVVFDEQDNGSGTFTDNTFTGNNISGDVDCQGIVVIGNTANVVQSGNSATPGPAICAY